MFGIEANQASCDDRALTVAANFDASGLLRELLYALEHRQAGIFKRIDENRELMELLQQEGAHFLFQHPWVMTWLAAQDDFLTHLIDVAAIPYPSVGHGFPRPFPDPYRPLSHRNYPEHTDMSPKIYIAGPDIFRLDWPDFARQVKAECEKYHLTPLFPIHPDRNLDLPENPGISVMGNGQEAQKVMDDCLSAIHACDAVIANITPFRGDEPDAGTVFEVGVAFTLGKPVIGYTHDTRSIRERYPDAQTTASGGRIDDNGCLMEHFSLPCNLMVSKACHIVCDDFSEALAVATSILHQPREQ